MIRILLVDDHELVCSGFQAMLGKEKDFTVVGIAQSGEEAVLKVKELAVDVVLMDVIMPGIGGMEACKLVLKHDPNIKIIAVSIYNDGPIPPMLLKIGVMGLISKNSSAEELIGAIKKVVSGNRSLSIDVANNLAMHNLPGNTESPFERLSHRETEIAILTLQGKSIQEMASMLKISDKTINTYRYRIYEKLQVKNDVELTHLAIKYNFIDKTYC